MGGVSVDGRRYPSHTEMQAYLHAFSRYFGLSKEATLRLDTKVVAVRPLIGEFTAFEGGAG